VEPLCEASRLRAGLAAGDAGLRQRFVATYGSDPGLLEERREAALAALDRFLAVYGDQPVTLLRAPARLSLNPHCDHQGAWVPYALHARELLAVVAPDVNTDHVSITNVNGHYAPLVSFRVEEEIARAPEAWARGWFHYIEAPPVVAQVHTCLDGRDQELDRRSSINYVRAACLRLRHQFPGVRFPGLRIALNGNIRSGGGQSSSSALVVSTAMALLQLAGETAEPRRLAELCGEAEWYVGTRGGSGDHAAMLLGRRDGLTHLRFRPPFAVRDVRWSRFPPGYTLVAANSQMRSEKSAGERLLFNRGIFAYRFAFLALQEELRGAGIVPEQAEATESLGDLHEGRFPLEALYRLVLRLPESVTPRELAARFPEAYPAAARGCFGTEDPDLLPREIPLRGAAMFGLARVDRGRVMPDLLNAGDDGSMREFGMLMSITHDGDRLQRGGEPYLEHQERLGSARIERLRDCSTAQPHPLRWEPGFYGASTPELDRMVDVALRTEGVLGGGLMGAGGGGYVLILTRADAVERLTEALVRDYYEPLDKQPDIEPWLPTSPAGRLL
jgi:N-acetylgalactosamine kinase